MPDRKKSLAYLGAGLLFGLGVSVILLYGFSRSGLNGAVFNRPAIGAPAPDFELTMLSGEIVRLSEYRGKPVLLNFWATWCTPCKIEMPLIQDRYDRYSPNLVVLAVNFAEPVPAVQIFAEQNQVTFPLLLDPQALVPELYQVRNFPTTYFIDQDGIIQGVHIGLMSESVLDASLEKVGLVND